MAEPFLAEIRLMSFNFPPKGWAYCHGQLLPINQNQALFALLGTTYGGNGQTNFALPNLQGRTPLHTSNAHTLGQAAGAVSVTLTRDQLPTHAHALRTGGGAASSDPASRFLGEASAHAYRSAQGLTSLAAASVGPSGHGQPHTNLQPYLVLNFCIALQGIFPSTI